LNAEVAQVAVGDTKAYEFVFGGNYTLNRGESNETHQASIEMYEAKAEAAALSSISTTIRINPIKGMGFFRDQLNLADLFGGSWQDFNMNYESSSLIYRVCFPVWDGMRIQHDPTYVAYMLSNAENSQVPDFPTVIILSVLAVIIVASLILVVMIRRCMEKSQAKGIERH
jgi:hypothetical protein